MLVTMPTWIDSNFWAAMGGAVVASLLAAALAIGLRWADLPRPYWVFAQGGAGGGPPGEGGTGNFTLVNAGTGQAVDVWVTGVNCDAQMIVEGQPNHGLGNRLVTCRPGESLSISVAWTEERLHLVDVELSWSQASVRKSSRRTSLWIHVWGPPWENRPARVDLSARETRRRARTARYRMGRPMPDGQSPSPGRGASD